MSDRVDGVYVTVKFNIYVTFPCVQVVENGLGNFFNNIIYKNKCRFILLTYSYLSNCGFFVLP